MAEMAFNHKCKLCPMKFISKTDLQLHLPVHSNTTNSSYSGFEGETEYLFQEFLQSFFPSLNPSDIPSLSPNSIPTQPDEAEQPISPPEEVAKIFTALLNMKVPGYDPITNLLQLEDLIPIETANKPSSSSIFVKKLPTTIRFVHPLLHAVKADLRIESPAIQSVYIEGPKPSIALIQNTHGDDRWMRTRPNILRPTVVSRIVPTTTHIPIEKPQYPAETPKEDGRNGSATPPIPKTVRKRVGIKPFSCEVCSKRFANLKILIAHKHINHTIGKLYSCFLCHKQFAFSHQLNQHLHQHTQKRHLGRHHRMMKGGRLLYSCDVCHRGFARINYLNLHRKCHERRDAIGQVRNRSVKEL